MSAPPPEKVKLSGGGTGANRRGRAALFIARFFVYAFLMALILISLFAFYILIVNATRAHSDIVKGFSMAPGTFMSRNFNSMMSAVITPVVTGIINSLIVSGGVALFACYFSSLTAFAVHAYDFKFKRAAFYFILAIMVIPTQISAAGFVTLVRGMGLTNNFIPLVVPAAASPVVFFFMKQYMEAALPIGIIEAARIDGSHEFSTFNRIVIPIMKPAIAVQAIITFVGAWNNYFVPALILEKNSMKTMPIIIAGLRGADFARFDMGSLYMTIAFAIFPIVAVYFVLSKYIVRGVAIGSVKG